MEQNVWVFKTNIRTDADVRDVAALFDHDGISQWSVDTNDCDAVLRVVTAGVSPAEIILSITNKGYLCSELTD